MAEAGLHELQVASVASQAVLVAAYCIRKALSAEAPDTGTDGGIVEVLVEGDHQDLVKQSQPLDVGLDKGRLPLRHDLPGTAVGSAQGLIEHLHHFVDDAGVHGGEGRQQDRVAALGRHVPQRLGRQALGEGGELPHPLGRDRGEVQPVRAESAEVIQLGDRGLDGPR